MILIETHNVIAGVIRFIVSPPQLHYVFQIKNQRLKMISFSHCCDWNE